MTAATTEALSPIHPPISYIGNKRSLAPWIISFFPKHRCYVEVFGGSGAVLLQKHTSTIEVYNDIDSNLTNLFHVIRQHPHELCELLDFLDAVTRLKGKAVISGYHSQLYDRYLGDWNTEEKEVVVTRRKGKLNRTEVLWMNF